MLLCNVDDCVFVKVLVSTDKWAGQVSLVRLAFPARQVSSEFVFDCIISM